MPFEPGQSGNPNGRKPGTPNKATSKAKDWLLSFLDEDTDLAQSDWGKLEAKDRWQLRAKLYDYITPRMKQTDLKIDVDSMTDEQVERLVNEILSQAEQATDNG